MKFGLEIERICSLFPPGMNDIDTLSSSVYHHHVVVLQATYSIPNFCGEKATLTKMK
jgi:hypothetical protein